MRRFLLIPIGAFCLLAGVGLWLDAQQTPRSDAPRYTAKNQMLKPTNYREWVWLSSGFGMSYREGAGASNEDSPFDNVFASPAAYRAFMETGEWPDKTVLMLESRASVSRASINRGGHFQGSLMGIEAHVKDSSRFQGKWAFFAFDSSSETGSLIPMSASCYSCHERSGAVDTTFVQFYPTLFEVAKRKGTVKADYEGRR
jgi:hypothetical protein